MGPLNTYGRRRNRKPRPRKDRNRRAPKPKRDEIPFGSENELKLTYFLEHLGVRGTSSSELDFDHKIDRLVTSVRQMSCDCLPMALQMTLLKNDKVKIRNKIRTFIHCASAYLESIGKPDSPLLYIEMSGRATWDMAKAVRAAIAELCSNPHKDGRRAHGLAVGGGGRSRWFKIQSREPKPSPREE